MPLKKHIYSLILNKTAVLLSYVSLILLLDKANRELELHGSVWLWTNFICPRNIAASCLCIMADIS